MLKLAKKRTNISGDTIIEVLIAITIAGLAIGTSYAIASKALQRAISARERDQALNVLESQVTSLKIREQKTDSATFVARFANTNQTHWCLDETATSPSADNWNPYLNYSGQNANFALATSLQNSPQGGAASSGSPYNYVCAKAGNYYVDITVTTTTKSAGSSSPAIYTVYVRWPRIGGGINTASIYYRF